MDVTTVSTKHNAKSDSQGRDAGKTSAAASLVASFADVLRNAGNGLQSQASSLLAQIDRSQATRETRPPERSDTHADKRAGNSATQDSRSTRRSSRDDGAQARDDTQTRSSDAPSRAASRDDGAAPAKPDRRAGTSKGTDKSGKDDAKTDAAANTSGDATQQAKDSAKPAAPAQEKAAPNSIPGQVADDKTAGQAAALAGQMLATKPADPVGNAAAQTAQPASDDAAAIAAIGGSANPGAAKAGSHGAAQNPNNGGQAANQMQAQAQAQAAAAKAAADPGDAKTQQAAALSRMTGHGNTISVRTTVTDPAAQLVSQPAAVLSASAATAEAAPKATTAPTSAPPPAPPVQPLPTATGAEANPLAAQAEQMVAQAARGPVAEEASAAVRPTVAVGVPTAASAANALLSGGTEGAAAGTPQMAGQTANSQQASKAQSPDFQRFMAPRQAAVDQVSVQITKALKDGVDRINIQLRPEHLGRVDVKMEVGHDGRVTAVVTADKQDTLNMLQRDARELARALQDQGFNTDSGSLSFSLREQGGNGGGDAQYAGGQQGVADGNSGDDAIAEVAPPTGFVNGIGPDGRIDIRA